MRTMANIPPSAGRAILIFGCAVALQVPFTDDFFDRNLISTVVEMPVLITVAESCSAGNSSAASVVAKNFKGLAIVAAFVSAWTGWAIAGEHRTKPVPSVSYPLIANVDAVFEKEVLHVAKRL